MPLSISIDDQSLLEGQETVTYYDQGSTSASFTTAVRYPITLREAAASNGYYQAGDVVWTIESSQAGSASITPGGVLYDSNSVTYNVLSADKSNVAGFWKLTTRNVRISAQLYDQITIQYVTDTVDAAGGISQSWTNQDVNVHCRVQKVGTQDYDARGVKGSATLYEITLPGEYVVMVNGNYNRVKHGNNYYRITNYRNAERIDELPVIECIHEP